MTVADVFVVVPYVDVDAPTSVALGLLELFLQPFRAGLYVVACLATVRALRLVFRGHGQEQVVRRSSVGGLATPCYYLVQGSEFASATSRPAR
jgi:hypothetical protein